MGHPDMIKLIFFHFRPSFNFSPNHSTSVTIEIFNLAIDSIRIP